MSRDGSCAAPDAAAVERRRMLRKRVLLSGVVADANGRNVVDCTIRDMTVRGAQVLLTKPLQSDGELYLIDTRNEVAHLAVVAWSKPDRTGLSFVRSYSLILNLPPHLEFLQGLLIEAKLRQVYTLVKRGIPVEEATRVVGLSEEYLDAFGKRGPFDDKIALLLLQAKRLMNT